MKRIFLILAFALWAAFPAAAQSLDRDMLLTPEGTLYTVESVFASDVPSVQSTSSRILMMTVQQGSDTKTFPVPDSLTGWYHSSPALAYDSGSDTLFVFWEKAINNRLQSDLIFASYHGGQWSGATSIDAADYHVRHNLRIAVTQRYNTVDNEGHTGVENGLTLHAVWWDETGNGESARYAMLTIDGGAVVGPIAVHDLTEFVGMTSGTPSNTIVDDKFNPEILRHPAVFESSSHDTVDIVWGDLTTDNMHRATISPLLKEANGRLRIPIGVRGGDFGGPKNFTTDTVGRITAISPDQDHLAFYFGDAKSMKYITFRRGVWSDVKEIGLSDRISADAAVEVLRRMVSAD